MRQVDLCVDLWCETKTTIGTGTQTIDIASLTAGTEAAAYAQTTGLPFGTTFQFLRVTLNRSMTITGSVGGLGGATCYTDGNAAGTATALHTGSTSSGDLASTTLYIADAGQYGNDSSIGIYYSDQNISYARIMEVGQPASDQMRMTYQLTKPYLVGLIAPKIQVKFNTSAATGGGRDGAGNCLMWPSEPVVVISITE